MRLIPKHIFFLLIAIQIISCTTDDGIDKDEQKPTITINYDNGFPQPCTELKKGNTYNFRAIATDNKVLASYSLDIHNNFDHHTHDDQGAQCDLEPIKQAINPLIFMENFSIENSQTSYEINIAITIPNDIDTGDYHCQYSITDETGWQSRTSIDMKIVD